MNAFNLVLPLLIIALIVWACCKKIDVYAEFVAGVKDALNLVLQIFPCLVAVLIMINLAEVSGVKKALIDLCAPVLRFVGVDSALCELVIIKPFSGSGSLAVLENIIKTNGANSFVAKVAAVAFGSSETIFYVSALYYSGCKNKKNVKPVVIALFCHFVSFVFATVICRFF